MADVVAFSLEEPYLKRLDRVCCVRHASKSKVLTVLVILFLDDTEFQDRVLRRCRE